MPSPTEKTWLLTAIDTSIPTTAFNDINLGGPATRTYPVTAAPVEIVSSDTDDDAAGIGARKIALEGYGDAWVEQTEIVETDGTTPALSTLDWLRVCRARVCDVGTAGINQGNITITAHGATADAGQVWQIDDPGGTPSYVDETTDFNSAATGDVDPFPAAEAIGDQFAIGFLDKFNALSIDTGTAGNGTPAITWKYWNGSAWVALDSVSDGTSGFTVTGAQAVTWTMPSDWKPCVINASDSLYYVVAEVATVYGTTKPVIDEGSITGSEQCRIPSGIYAGHSYQTDLTIPAGYVGTLVGWGVSHSDTTNHAEAAVFAKRSNENFHRPITGIVRLGDGSHSWEHDDTSDDQDVHTVLPAGTDVTLRAVSYTAASAVAGWIKVNLRKMRDQTLPQYS